MSSQPPISPPADPQYDHLIHLLHTKLPQKLYDQIESTTYELIFCPGHLYFDVSTDKGSFANTGAEIQKAASAARPELLLLSKNIYNKYAVRMWQDNICKVKTESGKVRQIMDVKGHLTDPLSYLSSINESSAAIQTLRGDPYPIQSAMVAAMDYKEFTAICKHLAFYIYMRPDRADEASIYYGRFVFFDTYGAIGEWMGCDVAFLKSSLQFAPERARSCRILWNALALMMGRTRKCHREMVPEMAGKERRVEVGFVRIGAKVYVFT